MYRGAIYATVTSSLLVSSVASAQASGDTCVTAYEQAQILRRKGELVRSKADLLQCTHVCPSALASDCEKWLNDVDKEIPTLVVSATSDDGQALDFVRVSIDGRVFVGVQGASPIEVDPGRRRLIAEDGSGTRVETMIDVPPRKKSHAVAVRFPAAKAPPAASGAGSFAPIGAAPAYDPRPAWALAIAGVGFLGVGVGGVLSIVGHVDRSELASTCAPTCAQAQVDAIATKWVAGGITASAGLAVGALGLWLYFRPTQSNAAPVKTVNITPLPGGGQISLRGAF